MPTYTIQCAWNGPWAATVIVEAESPEEACETAIQQANDAGDWRSSDACGATYIDAIRPGAHNNAWPHDDDGERIEVPWDYSEPAADPLVGRMAAEAERLVAAIDDWAYSPHAVTAVTLAREALRRTLTELRVIAPEPPADDTTSWTAEDDETAQAQGWCLIHSDSRGLEVQRDDETGLLASDDEALAKVRAEALAGCRTAIKALAMVAADRRAS